MHQHRERMLDGGPTHPIGGDRSRPVSRRNRRTGGNAFNAISVIRTGAWPIVDRQAWDAYVTHLAMPAAKD
jgi:hypothetical protein